MAEAAAAGLAREGVDDIGFRPVVADTANNVSTIPARLHVTGMSTGAIMSMTLACNTSISSRRVVSHATTLSGPRVRCRSSTPWHG